MAIIPVQVSYQSVMRAFTLSGTAQWADIVAEIAQSPGITELNGNYYVQYRDSDGDLVTISTDEELGDLLATGPAELVFEVVPKPGYPTLNNQIHSAENIDSATQPMEEDKETKPDKGKGPEVMDSFAPLLDQISETIGRFRGMFEEPEVAAKVNEFGSKVLGFDGSNSEFDLDAFKQNLESWSSHIHEQLQNNPGSAPWWAPFATQMLPRMQADDGEMPPGLRSPTPSSSSSTPPTPPQDRKFRQGRGGRWGPYPLWSPGWSHSHKDSKQEIDEKLSQLSDMGFYADDDSLKQLLQENGGKVERVVELLVRG